MSTNLHVMGNRIRTARQFRKLTAEQLSEQLGIATESLRHIENGTRRPSYALLDNISDILDVSLDYLAGKTELPLERRVRRELENMGLTKAQEDACVEIALNAIPVKNESAKPCTCRFSVGAYLFLRTPHDSTGFALTSPYYVLIWYD